MPPIAAQWLGWELAERGRSLERRVRATPPGQFKPLADFDWSWRADGRAAIQSS
jgi:hypothetical protein